MYMYYTYANFYTYSDFTETQWVNACRGLSSCWLLFNHKYGPNGQKYNFAADFVFNIDKCYHFDKMSK